MNEYYKDKNLIISPLSIHIILSLTANGAKNQTQLEMINTLGSKTINEINEINRIISSTINKCKTLTMANTIMSKFKPLESFKTKSKIYNAEIQKLENVAQVNKWCKEKTKGKIDKIIDELNSDIKMILLNAIYFKGTWLKEFKNHLTSKQPFFNEQKTKNKYIDMMKINDDFNYYENSDMQMIELPFEKDYMSAIIILPKDKINTFINSNKLNENLNNLNKLKYESVNLELPKFELKFESSLNDILKNIGIKLAFTSNADFSGIKNPSNIFINNVLHKTYLKVNEEGTEAAAVTSGWFSELCIEQKKEYNMIVNKPFLFLLRNNKLPENHQYIFMTKIWDI